MSLEEAKEEATNMWAEMSDDDKLFFSDKARQDTDYRRQNPQPRQPKNPIYTTPASSLSKEEQMLRFVNEFLGKVERHTTEPHKFEFIFVDFNYQSYHIPIGKDDDSFKEYHPNEVALCKYSIDGGVTSVFHTFIDPGPPRTGRENDALTLSQKTHKIPVDGLPDSSKDYSTLLKDIAQFAGPWRVLFARGSENAKSFSCFKFLENAVGADAEKVVCLNGNHLLKRLWDLSGAWDAETDKVTSLIEGDMFEDVDHLACNFHSSVYRAKYCAQHQVVRMGYKFASLLNEPFKVKPSDGIHRPFEKHEFHTVTHTPCKEASGCVGSAATVRTDKVKWGGEASGKDWSKCDLETGMKALKVNPTRKT